MTSMALRQYFCTFPQHLIKKPIISHTLNAEFGVIPNIRAASITGQMALVAVEFEGDVRIINEAEILEGSIVDEPMNEDTQITAVKGDGLVSVDDLKAMTTRELEAMLAQSGLFSRKAIKALVAEMKQGLGPAGPQPTPDVLSEVLAGLESMRGQSQA